MEPITSVKNERVALARSLNRKGAREETGLFLAEGEKLCAEVLKCAPNAVSYVLTTAQYADMVPLSVTGFLVPSHVIERVSGQKTPQGVVAVVEKAGLPVLDTGRPVVLDGVADPTNVGAIIRSAEAFGFGRVYLSTECADPFSPRAVRASMGSIFRVGLIRLPIEGIYDALKAEGWRVAVTHLGGTEVSALSSDCAVVIGSEARGAGEVSVDNADMLVKIPMAGGAESLNAAVAAGIMLYIASQEG